MRLRPNHPLADAHPGSNLEGDFGGTLRAEIIVADVGFARLILKGDAEFTGRRDRHQVPVCLPIAQLGKAEGSGRIVDLKVLHGMSGAVGNVNVHRGLERNRIHRRQAARQPCKKEKQERRISSRYLTLENQTRRAGNAALPAAGARRGGLPAFDQPRAQHHSVAAVVQFDGKDEHVPLPVLRLGREVRHGVVVAPIDVGLAGIGDGADDLSPFVAHFGEVIEDVAARIPGPALMAEGGEIIIDVLPVAVAIQDLDHHVVAHGHDDARVVEVARVDHDGTATALGLKAAQGLHQVVHRAASLEQMHVGDTAELAFQRRGQDDDRALRDAVRARSWPPRCRTLPAPRW